MTDTRITANISPADHAKALVAAARKKISLRAWAGGILKSHLDTLDDNGNRKVAVPRKASK